MNRLSYATVGEAFILGSEQIKNTQEEIAKLKSLILETSLAPPSKLVPKEESYQRIGPPDTTDAVFTSKESVEEDQFETMLIKLMKHPKFDDIVKNYISLKHPNLKETKYTPDVRSPYKPVNGLPGYNIPGGYGKENFGNTNNGGNVILFLLITVSLWIILSWVLNYLGSRKP